MNNTDIRSLYGLKYNPFLPDLPPEALYAIPGSESFALRVQSMAEYGGFALITAGVLHHRLEQGVFDLLQHQVMQVARLRAIQFVEVLGECLTHRIPQRLLLFNLCHGNVS